MKKTILMYLALVLFAFAGCTNSSSSADGNVFKSVSPSEAMNMMKNRENLLVVDVRAPLELRNGYIDGPTLIPFWEILKGKRSLPTDKPILLVCDVGGRSYGIGELLYRNGWPEIYNLSAA